MRYCVGVCADEIASFTAVTKQHELCIQQTLSSAACGFPVPEPADQLVMGKARYLKTLKHLKHLCRKQSDTSCTVTSAGQFDSPHLDDAGCETMTQDKSCTTPNKATYYTRLPIIVIIIEILTQTRKDKY